MQNGLLDNGVIFSCLKWIYLFKLQVQGVNFERVIINQIKDVKIIPSDAVF